MRVPRARTPSLPPWGRTECRHCANPVRLLRLADGTAVQVGMKPANSRESRADVAAMVIGNRLHGHRITDLTPAKPSESVWIRHAVICPVAPEAVQLALPKGNPS